MSKILVQQGMSFDSSVLKREGTNELGFISNKVSLPVGEMTAKTMFISNAEAKEGKSLKDASKVFCSVSHTFTDLETKKINKSEFVVNFDNLNSLAKKSGKELIKEDGTSIPVKASISKGIITFA